MIKGKRAHVEDVASKDDVEEEVIQAIVQTKRMKIDPSCNPNPKTDLGGTSGKNPLGDEFVRPARGFAKSVTETSSKVREPKTYNEATSDLIHGVRPLMRICGTLMLIKPSATLSCHTTKRRSAVSGYSG